MLPPALECAETVFFEFESVSDGEAHCLEKPRGHSRPFYELPGGEASYFQDTDQLYLGCGDRVRAICHPGAGSAFFSVIESEAENLWLASHLLFTISLIEILKRRGCYSLHAAGFGANGRGILIPGMSRAGKSTLAIALLRAKFDYLSDDMLFLSRRDDGLRVLAFPEELDVTDETLGFFPELSFVSRSPKVRGWPKRQVHPEEVFGVKASHEAFPAAVVLPRIANTEASILTRIHPDEALLEIAPNVLLTDEPSCRAHLHALAELVRLTPCYRLETGRDFDRLPILFRELLV